MSEPSPENPRPEPTFEEALAELQQIAGDLESGALGLEESLARFEQGIGLLRRCNAILERAEQKIEILTGRDAAGNPTFAPFDATATAASPAPVKPPQKPRPRQTQETVVVAERVMVESKTESQAEEDGPRLF